MSEEPEKKIRAFLAVNAPEEWREALMEFRSRFQKRFKKADIKWTAAEQFHITLRFFGHILSADLRRVEERVQPICARTKTFMLRFSGLGCFPRPASPQVFWCGVQEESGELAKLHQEITRVTADIGKAPDEREFRAHLTLARVKQMSGSLRKEWACAVEQSDLEIPTMWAVKEVLLMQSQLSPSGAKYSILSSFALG